MQIVHHKNDVYFAICNFEEQEKLTKGDTVHRPYRSTLSVVDYTRGTAVTIQDITDTDENLQVTTAKIVPFYVDDLDALQHNYRVANQYADDSAKFLGNWIDGDVLGEYDQATSSVDDGDLGGTDANGITVTTANIQKIFAIAGRKLDRLNIGRDKRFAVISPFFHQVLLEYLAGRESSLGDSTGLNAHVGKYMGFNLHLSNNLGWSATLAFGTVPTANDTVVINGVTFTYKATPAAAGEVDIGGDAPTSLDNLVAAVNNSNGYAAGAGSATAYFEVSAANRALLRGITATDGTTQMTLKSEGRGAIAVSETLTAAADVWTAAKQIEHQLFGRQGAIDLVIQKRPVLDVRPVPDKLGSNFLPHTLYGLKTFREGKDMLVDVQRRSDAD